MPQSKYEWIATLIGALIAVGCTVPLVQGSLSLSWPEVDGVITRSRDLPGRRAIGVDIGYRYAADGKTYDGNRFRFQFVITASSMQSRDVQSILGRYRVGEPVKVAVNPGNPSESVLEPGPDFNSMFPLAGGLFFMLLGLGNVKTIEPSHEGPKPPVLVGPRYSAARALAVMGFALFLFGAHNLYQGIGSTQWPSVEGRILYSSARTGSHPETLLWYEYQVGNRRYLASDYRNGGNITPFRQVAQAAAKRYPAGRAIPVYYNPRDPQHALLEPGLWWGNFVAPAFALLLFGAAWIAKKYAQITARRQ